VTLRLRVLVIIVALLIGLSVGAAAVLFALRPRLADLAIVRGESGALRAERDAAAAARDAATGRVIDLERELAAAAARLEVSAEGFDDRLANAVRAASTEAFQATNTQFLELAGTRLETTVAPLKESLKRVGLQVDALDRARVQSYGALRQQVDILADRTGNLANALRSPNVRGRWGESQLRNVVELSGMVEYCDFVTQASTRDSEGELLRPDLVVRIPGGKSVVVDAKVPLQAYLEAFETADDSERRDRLAAHARQVRDHMTRLSAKAYWRQFTPAPDFVVMFVPDETLLRVAHDHDPRLSEDGWSQHVIIASPSTLMSILRTVAAVWQQETVAESARQVSDLGRELYKRLSTMGAHVSRLGKSLDGAVKAYNETVGSLETRVLPQARAFERHGITGIEAPELLPIDRQTRDLVSPELVGGEQPALEILPGDAHAA
jgi:DNA recombination protein RmuC